MNKIYILIIAMLMILSCSDIREDVIIIQNNVNSLKIYRNDPYIYVQSKYDGIITHIYFTVNAIQWSLDTTIVKNEIKILYDMSYFINDRFYDERKIIVTNIEVN